MDGAFPSEKGQPFDQMSGGGGYGRGGGAPRRGFRGTAENAKTKLCTRWQQGDCRFGDRCNFAHGEDELRKLPPREDGGRFGGPGRGGPGRGGYAGGYNGGRGGPGPYGGGGRGRGYDDYGYNSGGGGGGGGYGGQQGGGYGGQQGGGYGGHPGDRPAAGQGGYGAPAGAQGAPAAAGAAAAGQMPEEVWAANGYPVQGPNGWVMYKVKETGEPYYHNHRTNTTQWERPSDWPAN